MKLWSSSSKWIKKQWTWITSKGFWIPLMSGILVLLVILGSVYYMIWGISPQTAKTASTVVTVKPSSGWHPSWTEVGIVAIIFVVVIALLSVGILYLKKKWIWGVNDRPKGEGEEESDEKKPGGKDEDKPAWKKWKDAVADFLEGNPFLIPAYVGAFWLVLTALLWLLRNETSTWPWPGGGVSLWQWVVIDHAGAYWTTPVFLTIGGLLLRVKSGIVKTVGLLFLGTMVIVWIMGVNTTTNNSAWKAEHDKKEFARKAHEAALHASGRVETPDIPIVVPTDKWSEPFVIPFGWQYSIKPPEEMDVLVNGKKTVRYDPTRYNDLGQGLDKLQFKAIHGHQVEMTGVLWQKSR